MSVISLEKQGKPLSSRFAPEQIQAQVRKIGEAAAFRQATNLQLLLKFIVAKTIEGKTAEINEHALAVEVLGKGENFNPGIDTIVRTQAYRLRLKLKEYYETEGRADTLLIEIPKGRYVPLFRLRDAESDAPPVEAASEIPKIVEVAPLVPLETVPANKRNQRHFRLFAVLTGLAILVAGVWLGWQLGHRPNAFIKGRPDLAQQFWTDFLDNDREPIIAFSNGVYLATRYGDLLRFQSAVNAERGAVVLPGQAETGLTNKELFGKTGPLRFDEGVTGTGDLQAATLISVLLSKMGVPVTVKRSLLVSMDDLRNHNIIFLGSPFDNPILRDIIPIRERFTFDFEPEQRNPALWRNEIRDLEQPGGLAKSYGVECNSKNGVVKADHAVISVLPGVLPNRKVMILGGLTTTGTNGAAVFVSSLNSLTEAAKSLNPKAKIGPLPRFFQCLLRVDANRGIDVVRVQLMGAKALAFEQ